MFIIFGFLAIAAISTLLPKLTHVKHFRSKSLKLVLFRALFMDPNRLPRGHLKLMLLFFNVFLFLNLNFLRGTIQTEKVTVSTDEIVTSASTLMATLKTLTVGSRAWLNSSPAGSFLSRLSKKQILEVDNLNDLRKMVDNKIENHVLFAVSSHLFYVMSILAQHANEIGAVAFTKSTTYYERLVGFPMRKSLAKDKKRFINGRYWSSLLKPKTTLSKNS